MSAPARRRAAADTDTVRLHAGTDSGESTEVAMTATRARRQREHKGGDAGTDCDESTEAANVSAPTRRPFAAESDTICHHAGTDKGESMEVATSALMATRAQRLRTCRHQRHVVLPLKQTSFVNMPASMKVPPPKPSNRHRPLPCGGESTESATLAPIATRAWRLRTCRHQ